MNSFAAYYGNENKYLETEGRLITKEETEDCVNKYIEKLDIEEYITINFSTTAIAPTSVTYDAKSGTSKINIGLPIEYREDRIQGVLHHEIGTHFLRRFNELQQPWTGKRKQHDLKPFLATEEGFASVNQLVEPALDDNKRPYLYKAAINYYTAYQASKYSFVELFKEMEPFIDDPSRRWRFVLRVKRGMQDTSLPGGFYKDQVYLQGAVKILKNRKDIDFRRLYMGKLTLSDSEREDLREKADMDCCKFPSFFDDME